jgi:hypothetical protein
MPEKWSFQATWCEANSVPWKSRLERIGRRPIVRREICAAVIVEACKIIHVMAEPRSVRFNKRAKNIGELAEANRGEQIGETDEIENWR